MKYTKEERLDIGRQIYDGAITSLEATMKFGIHANTARNYLLYYCDQNQLMPRTPKHKCLIKENTVKCCISLDKKVNKRLSEHSDETGISKSAIAAKAIKEYLEND